MHEDLHRGDGGGRTGVGGESGEGSAGTSLLDIIVSETGGEVRLGGRGWGSRDDVGAVNQRALVMAEDRHLAEGSSEGGLELGLIVCMRPPSEFTVRERIEPLDTH